MADLVIYGFETSNNMKVRVGLGYKGIEYEFRNVDPKDRSELVRVSGQQLTPVMVHGDVVLFDSAAILRYLDSNFPDTPRICGDRHKQQWEIDDWELFARTTLASPMMNIVHRMVYGEAVSESLVKKSEHDFAAATAKLAERLEGRDWLVSDHMTIADITAAAVVFRVKDGGFFPLAPSCETIQPWVDRVMAYDGKCRVG